MRSLRLRNCRVFYRGSIVEDAEILIENGRIACLSKTTVNRAVDEVMDLNGLIVIPGLIDVHVHLRGLNLAYKEDYDTGTMAAAAGGVTTVLDMPNTDPATENSESLKLRVKAAESKLYVNAGFYSFIPKDLTEIPRLARQGVFGFKVFMHRTMPGYRFDSPEDLKKPFKMIGKTGLPVLVHAEDREVFEKVKLANPDGGLEVFEKALSESSEEKAIIKLIGLLKNVGDVKVHFCHISSSNSIRLIAEAKSIGLPVTCEVTPHHLLLSRDVYNVLGLYGLVDPPLRSKICVKGLWCSIKHGVVDCIATDHAPHTFEEKTVGGVWDVKTGFPGLETLLPLMLDCVNRGWLSLNKLVELTSWNPAKIFGVKNRGAIEAGYWADLTAVDLKEEFKIDPLKFRSKAKHSPFKGWKIRGVPKRVFVNGELVLLDQEVVGKPGVGKMLKPGC